MCGGEPGEGLAGAAADIHDQTGARKPRPIERQREDVPHRRVPPPAGLEPPDPFVVLRQEDDGAGHSPASPSRSGATGVRTAPAIGALTQRLYAAASNRPPPMRSASDGSAIAAWMDGW